MNTVLSSRKVVARKEYYDDCQDHLDFGLIRKEGAYWEVDQDEAKRFDMTPEDIAIIQKSCDNGFKILPGDLHHYQAGKYDGDFYTVRCSIELSDILTKYDLWYED